MPVRFLYLVLVIVVFANLSRAYATHIAGAEINYTCLGGDFYDFTLTLYRDCINGEAPFDDPIEVFIFYGDNKQLYKVLQILKPLQTPEIPLNNIGACIANPPPICVHVGRYQWRIDLPGRVGGYYVGWARCCRNKTIRNLYNPLERGITFTTFVPGPELAACNSQPKFKELPPVFICNKQWLSFDHSALDLDGDSLVYELVSPYDGLNGQGLGVANIQLNPGANPPDVYLNNPRRNPPNNPMGAPPYQTTPFNAGYSFQQPFGLSSSTSLDPKTGLLRIYPTDPGLYVVAVAVFEYRKGKLISENRRDFQLVVLNCYEQNTSPAITHNLAGLTVENDTVIAPGGVNFCYQLTIRDTSNHQGLYGRGVSPAFGNGSSPSPYATPANVVTLLDSVSSSICWQPACAYNGQTVPLIYMAWDASDCPGYNRVFDTVWVRITPPPPVNLSLSVTFPPNFPNRNDTIQIQTNASPCVQFSLKLNGDVGKINQLNVQATNIGFVLKNTFIQQDTLLTGEFCYTPMCAAQGTVDRVILTGIANNACGEAVWVQDTVYFQVFPPENPRPTLRYSLFGLVTSGDTVLIDPDSAFCAQVTITDSLPVSRLFTDVRVLSSLGETANQANLSWDTQTDTLWQGKVCWKAPCGYSPALFRVVITLIDSTKCTQDHLINDTIIVRLILPTLLEPALSVDFATIPRQNDTLFYTANQQSCFNLLLKDIQPNYHGTLNLEITARRITGEMIPISVDLQVDSLTLGATICWRPVCNYFQEYILFEIIGKKAFACETPAFVYDSVWVWVGELPSRPPTIARQVSKPYLEPNTVWINVGEKFCYQVIVTDPDSTAMLTIEPVGEIWNTDYGFGSNAAIQDTILENPLMATICLQPNCYVTEKLTAIIFCSTDTVSCSGRTQVCDTLKLQIGPCDIHYVNVFTPNGDGINDFFQPIGLEGVESYKLLIFDRWGNCVFNEGGSPRWNGTFRENAAPEGVYYYQIQYHFFSGKGTPLTGTKVGFVTLVR